MTSGFSKSIPPPKHVGAASFAKSISASQGLDGLDDYSPPPPPGEEPGAASRLHGDGFDDNSGLDDDAIFTGSDDDSATDSYTNTTIELDPLASESQTNHTTIELEPNQPQNETGNGMVWKAAS